MTSIRNGTKRTYWDSNSLPPNWSLLKHLDLRGAAVSHEKCEATPDLTYFLPKLH